MMAFLRRYEVQLVLWFIGLLLAYLGIAYFVLAPIGYYGTLEQPRFADPWLARGETILSGGLLYRDVFTSTPPLTNYLFLPPVIFSGWFGHVNPWATLGFMVYFSLFALFCAFVLFYMADDRRVGYETAVLFLLNPLTLGNTVLRRQDETVVVFFMGVGILLFLRQRHTWSAVALGTALLVKLTGAMFLPIAFLHSWKWQYVVIPVAIFFLALSPFLILAGEDAMLWDTSKTDTEHPFQFDGVSLGRLWNSFHDEAQHISVDWASAVFLVGVGATAVFITWKRFGVLEDYALFLGAILLFSPKLHTSYYTFLIFALAPLVRQYRLLPLFFIFSTVALVADFYKWPVENFPVAFALMVVATLLLGLMLFRLTRPARALSAA
jgi:hypothetical protein